MGPYHLKCSVAGVAGNSFETTLYGLLAMEIYTRQSSLSIIFTKDSLRCRSETKSGEDFYSPKENITTWECAAFYDLAPEGLR